MDLDKKLFHRKRPLDKMDRLIQEAQEEGLYHGQLKRTLLGAQQGHLHVRWMQRAGTAIIVGALVVLATAWLGWPVPIILALLSICALISALSFVIGFYHLFRYLAFKMQPVERDQTDVDTRPNDSQASSDDIAPG